MYTPPVVTAETLAAVAALLPAWTLTLTSEEVPHSNPSTYWTAKATLKTDPRVVVSSSLCDRGRDAMMVLLSVRGLGGLPKRLGGTPESRAVAGQAALLLSDLMPE